MSNRIYPHPIIAREGWPILAGALIAVIVSWMLDLGIITFLFFVFLVFAFQFSGIRLAKRLKILGPL